MSNFLTTTTTTTAMLAGQCTEILDLLIIGGGLSGLMVAHDYHHRPPATSPTTTKPSWKLLEARQVLGGRLANDDQGRKIDLGGAWIWPHHQPNLKHLLPQILNEEISTFAQPDDPSSTRIDGGAVALIHALSNDLPSENIQLNAPVTKCTRVKLDSESSASHLIEVETSSTRSSQDDDDRDTADHGDSSSTSQVYRARQVVIAVPPKLISKHIHFEPPLSTAKQRAMEASHTWMAGVTKVSLVYPTRFWTQPTNNSTINTNMGLPTHLGPAFQVYDASTRDGSVAAITFFALVSPESEAASNDKVLAKLVTNQLAQVWAYFEYDKEVVDQLQNSYLEVHIKRWPLETYISEDPAPRRIHPHPHPVPALAAGEWDGTLLFAGSESDQESPGVMEGAIGAALRVLQEIP
mmetsp:Transcript_27017/g.44552  ORF Transcript_27017/g.44552 Transcript_27017/m.44552 type:complete len:408 (-) Transcript_27017:202-1425(-)